jgi:arsenate reductase
VPGCENEAADRHPPACEAVAIAEWTIYEKPTCTTCRNLFKLLTEQGVDFDKVDYHVLGLTEDEVRDIVAKTGLSPRDLLRTREPEYKEFVAGKDLSDDDLIALMVAHPALLQRPVVIRGDRAVLARPIEKVRELF